MDRQLIAMQIELDNAHDVRDVFARDLNRMIADSEKDEADRDAIVASLTDELRRAKAKAEQYQCDWMAAKAEFGDRLAALRQRHAEAVEASYREAAHYFQPFLREDEIDKGWLASEAKKGLA
jgi:hypothetical protein